MCTALACSLRLLAYNIDVLRVLMLSGAMDIPAVATLRRAPLDSDVIVGIFEEQQNVRSIHRAPVRLPPPHVFFLQGPSKDKSLLPDLASCQMPLRMKITPADPAVKTSEEQLTLQDASGKQSFKGFHGQLDNNYVVIMEDGTVDANGIPVLQVLPVSHWVNFQRTANLPQLNVEEQAELYDMLQKYGDGRPSRAKVAMDRYNEKMKGSSKFADEGGLAVEDLEGTESGFGGNYRTSMAASVRLHAKGGGGGGRGGGGRDAEDGAVFDGEDFDAVYDNLGRDNTAAGGPDDEFGDVADADARVRARDGAGYDDDALREGGGGALQFDVVGDEAGLEEAAADLAVDYFADDAGDDGAVGDEDGIRLDVREWDADDIEAGGAAALRGMEDELGVDLDADHVDGDELAKAAAQVAAAAAKPAEEEPKANKKRPGAEDEGGRASKRGRFDADNVESMKEELVSFLRAQGGKATAAALSKAFGAYVQEASAKQRFMVLVGEITKQTKEVDGKLYFVLKK